MKHLSIYRIGLGLMVLAMIALVGCSTTDPISSNNTSSIETDGGSSDGVRDVIGESGMEIEAMITRVNLSSNAINLSDQDESVMVDENTKIYIKQEVGREANSGSAAVDYLLIPATFSDLNQGDTVRVQANPMDAETMHAASVTVEGQFNDPWLEIAFTDRLASIDTTTFEVTFESNPFGGEVFVCAVMKDTEGNWIWLRDFNVGELVDVGGRMEDGVFVIYQMIKVAE